MLRAEKLDAKTLIHNYGHGGAGMSLSWGTGQMAAELALEQAERRAAVLGSGVVGLTTARQLQRRGFEVTIYAATVPPDTTSNMSLAGFTPTSGLVNFSQRTPAWDEQFRHAVEIAYRQLQLLVGPKYGISWIYNYSPTEEPQSARGTNPLLPDSVRTGSVVLQPREHPFPSTYAIERPEMRIEPSIYLDALTQDVLAHGGKIQIRRFETAREVAGLDESVIVNCTGLGAKALFGDPELVPLKGQLIVLMPQDEVNYSTNGGVSIPTSQQGMFIHMMPRRDGIILGGTSERDVWTLDINDAERKRVVEGHMALFENWVR
jgi:glycine/D-amino acid oxidase-like deaminating enzyme